MKKLIEMIQKCRCYNQQALIIDNEISAINKVIVLMERDNTNKSNEQTNLREWHNNRNIQLQLRNKKKLLAKLKYSLYYDCTILSTEIKETENETEKLFEDKKYNQF